MALTRQRTGSLQGVFAESGNSANDPNPVIVASKSSDGQHSPSQLALR